MLVDVLLTYLPTYISKADLSIYLSTYPICIHLWGFLKFYLHKMEINGICISLRSKTKTGKHVFGSSSGPPVN
jgi:hypothetical protein